MQEGGGGGGGGGAGGGRGSAYLVSTNCWPKYLKSPCIYCISSPCFPNLLLDTPVSLFSISHIPVVFHSSRIPISQLP